MDTGKNGNYREGPRAKAQGGDNAKKKSLVIVRQSYTYLETFVRSMFEGADDIRIIIDRRFHERRQVRSEDCRTGEDLPANAGFSPRCWTL